MQSPDQIEEFAGQRILTLDPRTEKNLRVCAACGSTNARRLGVKNELDILSCLECDTLYTPYSPWYSSSYFYVTHYEHEGLSVPPFVRTRLEEITSKFAPYRQTNRLLDIGCGAGLLLEAARKNGWNGHGLDVAPKSVEHVRELGFEVFQGELLEAAFPSEHFDVITASELLEHLFEPKLLVKEVARLLRPGGLFWATTPHARGLSARVLGLKWRCIWPPEHLQLFSVRGVKRLLHDSGFREVRVNTTGGNPIEIYSAINPNRSVPKARDQHFDRVATEYQLNESLMKSPLRRALKHTVNGVLNFSRLGDSMKVFAVR